MKTVAIETSTMPMPTWLATKSLFFRTPTWRAFARNGTLTFTITNPPALGLLEPLPPRKTKLGADFGLQHNFCQCQRRRPCHNFHKRGVRTLCFKVQKYSKCTGRQSTKDSKAVLHSGDLRHLMWWEEKMLLCKKPSNKELVKRLVYSNLLGLDENLKNGSLKDGSLNWELLQFKRRFPREVLLCRVGEFYEAFGFDACILVEYAGLNPVGGTRSDTVPKAGCPVMNLRQTLDELTRNGFSACVVEEVQGPSQARTRKERFISGHAHPGSPYVYGLAGADIDVDFPEPVPVIGISRSARGYCFVSVLEAMQTYSVEDGLTEEAIIAKLRARPCHLLFLHSSLRKNSSGTSRWGAFGEGGLLWGECTAKHHEWFDGDPVSHLLSKVRELYGIDPDQSFRNVTVPSDKRPRPLYLGTATQIGVMPTEGIPSLLKVLLPSDSAGLCAMYLRDLLLNPPTYQIALSIQAACRLMSGVTCAIPDFTCVPAAKLVKLIGAKEANHIEFSRIQNMAKEILCMHEKPELSPIVEKLLDPAWVATGLKIDRETLVSECMEIARAVGDIIFLEGEPDQAVSCSLVIPAEFFVDMESSWKGRVKRVHAENVFQEVERAAEALSAAVEADFLPIVLRVKAISASPGGCAKGEICYAKEHESIWFKGKRFIPAVWGNTSGEEQIKHLIPATDAKGKKFGDEWHTTKKVEEALHRYREAVMCAKLKILEILRGLAVELQTKMNTIVFISVLSVIIKTLFAHVSEGRRRKWVFPTLKEINPNLSVRESGNEGNQLKIVGLIPYWLNTSQASAIENTIEMQSLFLLTGPNGGGKSSVLRSIGATSLLGICGLMVPADTAVIPHFDSIMLHMASYDSPADGKSSFQMEMSEMRSLLLEATNRSLVLVDEICRGTEVQKGTCIAASIIEELDSVGCMGVISTHLHGLLDLSLHAKNIVYKAMGIGIVNGQIKPTWKLIDGVCRESLAFETARYEGIPENIVKRAEDLYVSSKQRQMAKSAKRNGNFRTVTSHPNKISFIGIDPQASCEQTDLEAKINTPKPSDGPKSIVEDNNKIASYDDSLPISNGEVPRHATSNTLDIQSSESTAIDSLATLKIDRSNSTVSALVVHKAKESRSERNLRLLKEAEKVFISMCEKKLLELHGQKLLLPNPPSICCSLIGARERPPPTSINSSCVYILQRPDGKFYVGQTDDLAGRISAHRTVEGLQRAPFLYIRVPGKSVARELETLLINQLPLSGFELVNKADQNHHSFGTYHLTSDIPPF
eukprot:Gb_16554 [translate_table: standard]